MDDVMLKIKRIQRSLFLIGLIDSIYYLGIIRLSIILFRGVFVVAIVTFIIFSTTILALSLLTSLHQP